jgi:pimeloyl-ACP methyl ester carboxylesterase
MSTALLTSGTVLPRTLREAVRLVRGRVVRIGLPLAVIASACTDPEGPRSGSAPSTVAGSPFEASPGETPFEDTLEYAPVFDSKRGSPTLSAHTHVAGTRVVLDIGQAFESTTGTLALTVVIRNDGPEPIGAPLRLTVSQLLPAAARVLSSDAAPGLHPVWDFSQLLGASGSLSHTVTSGPREVDIQTPSRSPQALKSLRVSFVVSGVVEPPVEGSDSVVVTSETGAKAIALPGTLNSPQSLGIRDTVIAPGPFFRVSSTGHRVTVALTDVREVGGIRLDVPLSSPPDVGQVIYLRVRISGASEDYWAKAALSQPNQATVTMPASGLREIATLLKLRTLDLVTWAEEYPEVRTQPVSPEPVPNVSLRALPRDPAVPCVQQISGLVAGVDYAPCEQTILRDRSPGTPGGPAVVLVHGWMNKEANWLDYYRDQGINCRYNAAVPGIAPAVFLGCTTVAGLTGPRELPGEIYFSTLDANLRRDLPQSSLSEFDYESYHSIEQNAQGLAAALAARFRCQTCGTGATGTTPGFVLVAHSMGGLIARRATQILEALYPPEPVVLGVVTLATPHLGTPGPLVQYASFLLRGVDTKGGRNLVEGISGTERAPLYAYAGSYDISRFDAAYDYTRGRICVEFRTDPRYPNACDNDGAVPRSSAHPPSTVVPATKTPFFATYHHSAMALKDVAPGASDPLYASILRDVCAALPCLRFPSREITTRVGDPPRTIDVKLAGLATGSTVQWRALNGIVALAGSSTTTTTEIVPAAAGIGRIEVVVGSFDDPVAADTLVVNVLSGSDPPPPPPPPPPPNRIGGNNGSSFDDPHLRTVDGRAYDFHSVGDYVLTKSTSDGDDFEVQTRYRILNSSVSLNDAVAVRVVRDVINVFPNSSGFELIINSETVSSTRAFTRKLPGGGTIQVSNGSATISWPDRTVVNVENGGVKVLLSPARLGKVEGLLGNYDGDPNNDIRVRNGPLLNDALDGLYVEFRQSWRVPLGSAESLFRRGPDLWDPSFPRTALTLGSLDPGAVERARATCRAAGVVHPQVLDACAFDLVVTGDNSWANVAVKFDPSIPSVTVAPALTYLIPGETRQFTAAVNGTTNQAVTWTASGGSIVINTASSMTYMAPSAPGTYAITARSVQNSNVVATATVSVSLGCASPPPGLVSWWPGDGNANDIVGSNHGALQNGATFAAGLVGPAFSFDGAAGYDSIPDSPTLTPPSSLTLDAWIKPNNVSGPRAIVTKYSPAPLYSSWDLIVLPGGRIRFEVYQSGVADIGRGFDTVDPVIRTGVWQHVAATFDAATQASRIYVDGVEVPASLSFGQGQPPVTAIRDGSSPVRIGAALDNGGNMYLWNGLIDEVDLFDRALTSTEIQAIYKAGGAGKCQSGPTNSGGTSRASRVRSP